MSVEASAFWTHLDPVSARFRVLDVHELVLGEVWPGGCSDFGVGGGAIWVGFDAINAPERGPSSRKPTDF
jgi:hypothetical protein